MPFTRRTLRERQKRIVAAAASWKCQICEKTVNESYQIDHVIPLWANGPDTIENCQLLCAQCHADKTYREEDLRHRINEIKKEGLYSDERICLLCARIYSKYFQCRCNIKDGHFSENGSNNQ